VVVCSHLVPLLTRFRDIHFRPYTEEEFIEIVVKTLDREEGIDRDIALIIDYGVFNRLKSLYQPEVVIIEYPDSRQCCDKTEIISTITEYSYNLAYTTPANPIFVHKPLGWVS
jgi:hypothetical protein